MSQKFRIIFIILNLYISTYKSIIRYIIFSKPSTLTPHTLNSSYPQFLIPSIPILKLLFLRSDLVFLTLFLFI